MARKKKTTKVKEVEAKASPPVEVVDETPTPVEEPSTPGVSEKITADTIIHDDEPFSGIRKLIQQAVIVESEPPPLTRIEQIEKAIASDETFWWCTTNHKPYKKDGIYPEDDFILNQNKEDLANGYPNRFFRKM